MAEDKGAFAIDGKVIGGTAPCFVIAEAGVNHNGDLGLAHRLVDVAADAQADAVKFQTFKADRLASPAAAKAEYQKSTTSRDESQLDMLRRLELGEDSFRELKRHCEERRITFLSSPFEEESADLLERIGVAAFKIPSGELTNSAYLAHVAAKGRPVILSTGMATLDEVSEAVATIARSPGTPLALLHCTSSYPAAASDSNLRAMATLADRFGLPVGYSDHSEGVAVSIAAAALGAVIIEKHFTLDPALPGPDHKASLDPAGLRLLVDGIRTARNALGDGIKAPRSSERPIADIARKSVVAVRDLAPGMVIEPAMVAIMRPGTGIPPASRDAVHGRKLVRAVAAGAPLQWNDLA